MKWVFAVFLIASSAVVGGCGSGGDNAAASSSRSAAATGSPASAEGPWSPPVIDPANFVSRVDNPYFPLAPGTTLLYRGVLKDGATPQVDNFTVTHGRK